MSTLAVWLGAVELGDVLRRWRTMTPAARDRVVILSVMAALTLALVIWAVVFRRKPRHSHRHSYEYPRASAANPAENNEGDAGDNPRKRRKWRRQRRPHRPLNPTLAQTGGLPPIRSERPPQPPR